MKEEYDPIAESLRRAAKCILAHWPDVDDAEEARSEQT